MKKKLSLILLAAALTGTAPIPADACTGITLKSQDGRTVVARTIEWGGSDLESQYVIVPRGYRQQSFLPGGATDGMSFTARHGYVGLSVEQEQFVAETRLACPPDCSTSPPTANTRHTIPRRRQPPSPTYNWWPTCWANVPR